MLWRSLQSPLRRIGEIPPCCFYLCSSFTRTRTISQVSAIRRLHDQKAANANAAPQHVRHDRLLAGPGELDNVQVDKPIKVTGLVRSIRKQKKVAFARIGDGSTLANIQAVFPDPQLAKEYVGSYSKSLDNL